MERINIYLVCVLMWIFSWLESLQDFLHNVQIKGLFILKM